MQLTCFPESQSDSFGMSDFPVDLERCGCNSSMTNIDGRLMYCRTIRRLMEVEVRVKRFANVVRLNFKSTSEKTIRKYVQSSWKQL